MIYRFHRPRLVPTLAVISVAAFMFALCFWQIQRLEWKTALLSNIEKAQSAPPESLLSYTPAQLPNRQWHNVIAAGRLLHDKELYATPRYYKEQMGYAVLTPLAMATPSGTVYVLVNRGWVNPAHKEPGTRASGNPKGQMTVEGVIRSHFHQPWLRPDNAPHKNLWFWYDLQAMGKYVGLPLLPIIIDATRITLENGKALKEGPTPFPISISIRNDHLGYAITWFLVGMSAIAMFVIAHLERVERNS